MIRLETKNSLWRLLIVFSMVVFGSSVAWYTNYQSTWGIDDANIYMVYMKNVASGHGFVYNIGGERVEGFTSVLWTLIGALMYKISSAHFNVLLIGFNVVAITYALFRLSQTIDNYLGVKNRISALSLVPLMILSIMPGYFDWTIISLMETGIWSCELIVIAVLILDTSWKNVGKRNLLLFNLLTSLMLITRPESMVWVPLLLMLRSFKLISENQPLQTGITFFIKGTFIPITVVSGLILWRLWYFGYPFPNTFYAKVSSDTLENFHQGIKYIYKAFQYYPYLLPIVVGLVFWIPELAMKDSRKAVFAICVLVISFYASPPVCTY